MRHLGSSFRGNAGIEVRWAFEGILFLRCMPQHARRWFDRHIGQFLADRVGVSAPVFARELFVTAFSWRPKQRRHGFVVGCAV